MGIHSVVGPDMDQRWVIPLSFENIHINESITKPINRVVVCRASNQSVNPLPNQSITNQHTHIN
jgi:hypothetical protein